MALSQKQLVDQAEALQEYLFTASSDGWGPEVVICSDRSQAIRLHNAWRAVMHLAQQPAVAVVRHGRRITVWLTEVGHRRMRQRVSVATASPRGLEWHPQVV